MVGEKPEADPIAKLPRCRIKSRFQAKNLRFSDWFTFTSIPSTYTPNLSKKAEKIDTFSECVDDIDNHWLYVDEMTFYRPIRWMCRLNEHEPEFEWSGCK